MKVQNHSGRIGGREIKESAKVALVILLSRLTGFLRELVVAFLFGTSWIASSLVVATRLPNMFRRLLGEGTLSSVFVSLYSREIVRDPVLAREKASKAYSSVMTLGWIVSLIAILAAPLLVRLVTFDFSSHSRRILMSISLSRITLPYIGISTGVAFLSGLLNSHGFFYQPMFSQVVLNTVMILFAFSAALGALDPNSAVFVVAAGFVVGGFAQLLYQRFLVRKKIELGSKFLSYKPAFYLKDPFVKEMLLKTLPGIVGLAAYEANIMIDTLLAWHHSEAAVSSLYYANRIYLLPVGVIGAAFYTVILPLFARNVELKKKEELAGNVYFSLMLMFFLTLPLLWLFMLFPKETVAVVFMRGRFSLKSVLGTSRALSMLSIATPFAVALKVMVSLFYSHKDTVTPMKGSVLAMFSNSVLDLALISPLGYSGLALASALSVILNFSYLVVVSLRKHYLKVGGLLKVLAVVVVFSVLSFLAVFSSKEFLRFLSVTFGVSFPSWGYLGFFLLSVVLFYGVYILLGYLLFRFLASRSGLYGKSFGL